MDTHAKAFKEEAYEILFKLESLLLELTERPDQLALIDRVFAAIHTIKGSGSMFGFDVVAQFTHEIESVLDLVREGFIPVSQELIGLMLGARDKITEMLDQESDSLDEDALMIMQGFKKLIGQDGQVDNVDTIPEFDSILPHPCTYRIRFAPSADIFATGTNPLLLLSELKEMGDCTVIAGRNTIPYLEEIDPESCYFYWDIFLTTDRDEKAIRDVFIFVEDKSELIIEAIYEHVESDTCDHYKRLGEILLERGDVDPKVLDTIVASQKKIGERLVEEEIIDRAGVDIALTEQKHVRKVLEQERNRGASLASIRIDAKRLDNLVDLVGELVTLQARLSEKASGDHDPELKIIAESVERLTDELRNNTMSIRMVPMGTLFSRFRRLIHDLSRELGKEVMMTTEGAATELDKTVIDQLHEPLVHIIRNAVDHGIEFSEDRVGAGKPAKGTVHLAAHHAGASVVIEIKDDGAGLDKEMLKSKAIDKGLIPADAELNDEECYALILIPGFSTAGEVTDVSGRGVGMDVVKRSIENLGGTINISSVPGTGTAIKLCLPLTLAIIDGLLVRIGGDLFIIPLTVIEECIEITREEAEVSGKRSMMVFRGEVYTYISLRDTLGIDRVIPPVEKVILVNVRGRKTGFSVDQVIGQHQAVIKTLSRICGNIEGISGATILGDGTVALILDVNQLVTARQQSAGNMENISMKEVDSV